MLVNIVFGAFALLAIVVTVWAVAVAFRPTTKPQVRKHAMEVFRVAWKTAVVAVLLAVLRLYASGALDLLGWPAVETSTR